MKITVDSGGGQRLDRYLVFRYPRLSRALIMKYLKEGRARINGRRARPGLHVNDGDDIDLPDWEDAIERIRGGVAADLPQEAQGRPRRPESVAVIYDDEDMVVVDKPPGLRQPIPMLTFFSAPIQALSVS